MKLLIIVCVVFTLGCCMAIAGPRDAEWKKVDEAIEKGLPKTAIELLEPIIQGAMRDKAYGEAAKAIARRIVLEGNIQGNKPEEKITRLQAELEKAPPELKPILHAIQAHWFWHYFQQNRWRFMRRTATATAPGKDFTTWDLPRLFQEIDREFALALSSADILKSIPVGKFDDLLEKGTVPDSYRPTMYDFIAHEALAFYTSGEQAAAKPEDAFEIDAASPIFAPAAEFIGWKPQTSDQTSPKLQAILLYQDLLKFHQKDTDKSAFLDVEIERLAFGYNTAFGDEKNPRYKAALKALVEQWGDHELSALARHNWARVVHQEGDWVQARQIAQQGAGAFPKSHGGKMCRNLILEIEARELEIQTERVWNAPWPKIQVTYRNITRVHFRAVPWDWGWFLQKQHRRPDWLDDQERRTLLAKKPALEWTADLPATEDFKSRMMELPAPDKLPAGFYFIVASYNPDFGQKDNLVSFAAIWVSDLALVVRPRSGMIEGFVLEAGSGEPVAGAEIFSWHNDNNGRWVADPKVQTDENGFFVLDSPRNRSYFIRANHKQREIAARQEFYAYEQGKPSPYEQTVFFTDRAIYRPGQTINFKGICLRVDQNRDNYEVMPRTKVTVVLADPNGKEVVRLEQQCNDYGSFAGSFTAPRDRVAGRYRIYIQGGPRGTAQFNVEEYKRPKFQVTLEAPKVAAKLNETVSLSGKAEAYTGAAVDGAMVKYRVVRQVRYPYWWHWYYGWDMPASSSQEIAHGSARTGTDGKFNISFLAKPDPAVSPTNEPIFQFTVYADVTDTAGETRSAQRTIQIGYTALQAALSAADWQVEGKPIEIKLQTTTLDGEPQVAEGSLKIYKLREPAQVVRGKLPGYWPYWRRGSKAGGPQESDADPNTWPLGEVVQTKGFTTGTNGMLLLNFNLPAGIYRVMVETQDRFGKQVTARLPLLVLNPDAPKLNVKIPHLFTAPKWSVEPGEEFLALWGTGYDEGRAFIEIEHRNKIIKRYWTPAGRTQEIVKQAVDESMRGGFTVHLTRVRENRAYLETRNIDVPWSQKNLEIKWEHFVSKLQPGQKESWSAIITGPGAQKAVAEMVAALYDESLDAFLRHSWLQRFNVFRREHSSAMPQFENVLLGFQQIWNSWHPGYEGVDRRYRSFPFDLTANFFGYQFAGRGGAEFRRRGVLMEDGAPMALAAAPPAPGMAMEAEGAERQMRKAANAMDAAKRDEDKAADRAQEKNRAGAESESAPDLSRVSARKNLNETAFFFPQLLSDANGVVKMEFTMPEALTTWKFFGFAHDQQLRSGFLEDKAVTAKDIMVQPNPPRFLREGDVLEFTVKVSNQSETRQQGKVQLSFRDAATDAPVDKLLGNSRNEQSFDIPPKESRSFSWRLEIPDGCGFLVYKAVGATGKLSDGEEGYLPVLPRRILVTESLPLPIRGPGSRKFELTKLAQSGKSSTLRHQALSVQMVSNPAWYAILALPYLMEFPYECSEQIFNRLYANTLARHIALSDARIRRVFDQWRNTPALDSPLEKNQDLKMVMLEETPWWRQAQNESQARRNVGLLFEDNRLNYELENARKKLAEMQLGDGRWPWFPGGPPSDYITLYIVTGFGRLRHLGADVNMDLAIKALRRLDQWMDEHYQDILKWKNPEDYVPSPTVALYLYGRSFFLKDKPLAKEHGAAIEFFLKQSRKHWLKTGNRQSQGHLALALKRWGGDENLAAARDIMKSIKERSVSNEEMGMFWRDLELSWWWYRAPIETQALMIEAFDEVMGDAQAVEDCKVWLLKQKQTQDWKTTKATADACYALLLRGENLLASQALVEMVVGGQPVKPEKVEAGTGFYEKRYTAAEIKPKLAEVTVKKVDTGVAWGSIHWQYLEDMAKVTPHEGTPLKLKKTLYVKTNTKKGPVLTPVKNTVSVGDELVVRIELRTDRDMEYVHLKDQRGSGVEPVNVLSRYRYQDGLAYYETTRDTASHFFIEYLPKGVYVFEYSTRVQHRGVYQTGIAAIQCMYAPEFNSHSESFTLTVK